MKAVFRAFLLLVGVAIVVGSVAAYAITSRGLSTRVAPKARRILAGEDAPVRQAPMPAHKHQ